MTSNLFRFQAIFHIQPHLAHINYILDTKGTPSNRIFEIKYCQSATEFKMSFNYTLSSVRRVVECAIGIVAAKWNDIVNYLYLLHNTVIGSYVNEA